MGLGLTALGRPEYINLGHRNDLQANYDKSNMQFQTHQRLSLATSLGINYFDTALSYGMAEEFLDSWLKKYSFGEVVVGSKWGYYSTTDWAVSADKHEMSINIRDQIHANWLMNI